MKSFDSSIIPPYPDINLYALYKDHDPVSTYFVSLQDQEVAKCMWECMYWLMFHCQEGVNMEILFKKPSEITKILVTISAE